MKDDKVIKLLESIKKDLTTLIAVERSKRLKDVIDGGKKDV